jgi:hypothetical protein
MNLYGNKQNATWKAFKVRYKEVASISELHIIQAGDLA